MRAPARRDVPVSAALTGLKADTTYYYRLVATNSAATTEGGIASLTTAAAALSATTGQATTVGTTTAEVTGTVNPGGLTTNYWFEYGTSSFAAATAKASAGSGSGSVSGVGEADGAEAGYGLRLPAGRVELVRVEHGRPVALHDERGCRADGVDRDGLRIARRPA